MSVISTSDFANWKQDLVTEAFFSSIKERIGDIKEQLSVTAGLDSNEDCKQRGYLMALKDILDTSMDDVEGDA